MIYSIKDIVLFMFLVFASLPPPHPLTSLFSIPNHLQNAQRVPGYAQHMVSTRVEVKVKLYEC